MRRLSHPLSFFDFSNCIPLSYSFSSLLLFTYILLFIWRCNCTDMERNVAIVTISCLNHQSLFSLQSLDVRVITVHRKAALSVRSPWFYRHSCHRVVQSCAKRKVMSKEMRSVIALHHRELSTTEAHSHVISHTLSDGATIINREPCREVKCSLSDYLCCK